MPRQVMPRHNQDSAAAAKQGAPPAADAPMGTAAPSRIGSLTPQSARRPLMCMCSIGHVLRSARVEVRLVWQMRGIHHAAAGCAGEGSDPSSTATVPCPFPMARDTILFVCYAQTFFNALCSLCITTAARSWAPWCVAAAAFSLGAPADTTDCTSTCLRVRCQDRYAKPCSAHS